MKESLRKEFEDHKFQWLRWGVLIIFISGMLWSQWKVQKNIVEQNKNQIKSLQDRVVELDKRVSDLKLIQEKLQKISDQATKNGKRIYELRKDLSEQKQ